MCWDRFQNFDDDDEADGDGKKKPMANTAQESATGFSMIKAAPIFLETGDTGCMRDATSVTALADFHAQCSLKKKEKGTTQAPSDRTSNEMRGCHAKPMMGSGCAGFYFDFDDTEGKGKAKDPYIYRADARESNDDLGTNSQPPRTSQGYGGSIPRSHNMNPILPSSSSGILCLHSKNAVSYPVNNINDVQMTLTNTNTEFLTISEHGPCTKDDTLNQREATNAIDTIRKPLHEKLRPSGSVLQTMELPIIKDQDDLVSLGGAGDLEDHSLDPSFQMKYFEARHESSGHHTRIPSQASLPNPTYPASLSFAKFQDSLLMSNSMQMMASSQRCSLAGDSPGRTRQQIHDYCDALSKDDGIEGNGQSFHSQPYGQDCIDTQRDIIFRTHHSLHDPRSCSASLCNHVATLRAHVLQARQTMTREVSLTYIDYGSYTMAQQHVLAAQNKGAESSQAQDTPRSTADPSLEASNQSHDYFDGVLSEMLEGLTPSSVSRHNSRKRSRQDITRSRRPSSAPPSGSSKASSRATQARTHGVAAFSLLLRILCFSHSQAGQALAVAPESGSLWLQCHPISFPLLKVVGSQPPPARCPASHVNSTVYRVYSRGALREQSIYPSHHTHTFQHPHHTNDARDSDDGEQQIKKSASWLAIIGMEAM